MNLRTENTESLAWQAERDAAVALSQYFQMAPAEMRVPATGNVTGGGAPMVTITTALVIIRSALVARAVKAWRPTGALLQVKL